MLRFCLTVAVLMLDIETEWTLNALLTTSSNPKQEMFEAPDIRPLSASGPRGLQIEGTTRRSAHQLAVVCPTSWQRYGVCCRSESPPTSTRRQKLKADRRRMQILRVSCDSHGANAAPVNQSSKSIRKRWRGVASRKAAPPLHSPRCSPTDSPASVGVPRGSSSESRFAVPACQRYFSPSRSFRRTCGSCSMLRTYPAFMPCSATLTRTRFRYVHSPQVSALACPSSVLSFRATHIHGQRQTRRKRELDPGGVQHAISEAMWTMRCFISSPSRT